MGLFGALYLAVVLQNAVYGFDTQLCTKVHQVVVHPFYVGIIGYGQAFMVDNSARVDVFVQKKVVTPVSVSPLMTAQLMGAAPRYWGSRAACTLKVPRVAGPIPAWAACEKATTTCRWASKSAELV